MSERVANPCSAAQMHVDSRTAKQRLAEANAVLTAEEQAVMIAVCGKTQSLRAACRETGMGRKRLERVLRVALDKLAVLEAIRAGAEVQGPTRPQ